VAPLGGYTWTAVSPGAIPVLELMGLYCPAEIQNLTPGLSTRGETIFLDRTGGSRSAGGEAPENVHENKGGFSKAKKCILDDVSDA